MDGGRKYIWGIKPSAGGSLFLPFCFFFGCPRDNDIITYVSMTLELYILYL